MGAAGQAWFEPSKIRVAGRRELGMSVAALVTGYALRELEGGHTANASSFFVLVLAGIHVKPISEPIENKMGSTDPHTPRTQPSSAPVRGRHLLASGKSAGEHKCFDRRENRGANHTQSAQTAKLPHQEAAARRSTVAQAAVAEEYVHKKQPARHGQPADMRGRDKNTVNDLFKLSCQSASHISTACKERHECGKDSARSCPNQGNQRPAWLVNRRFATCADLRESHKKPKQSAAR